MVAADAGLERGW